MTRPESKDWPDEPWDVVHDVHHSTLLDADGCAILDGKDMTLVRVLTCVNALRHVRNPGAVEEVLRRVRIMFDPEEPASCRRLAEVGMQEALAALDREGGDG